MGPNGERGEGTRREVNDEKLEFDSSEFRAMLRGDLETDPKKEEKKPDENDVFEFLGGDEEEKKEVKVEKEETQFERTVAKKEEKPNADEIVALRREIEEIRQAHQRELASIRESTKREPTLEFDDEIPGTGVRFLKNRQDWPVQIDAQVAEKLGFDKEMAPALGNLAQFVYQLALRDAVIQSRRIVSGDVQQTQEQTAQKATFFTKYRDLAEHEDLAILSEQDVQRDAQSGLFRPSSREDYMREVAKRTRTRIARVRGQSLEDYESDMASRYSRGNGGVSRTGHSQSRAVTTSSGSRSGGRGSGDARTDSQRREMDDLL